MTALLTLATAAAVGLGVLLWLGLGAPGLAARTPAGGVMTVAERLEGLKIVLAVVAGIGAVVALTVAYRKQRDGELAEYREDAKAFSDRYGKAADQLGNAEHIVRVGGVHALAELADEWEEGRQMCIDLLCAYLRMPYVADPAAPDYSASNRQVRRTIIRVIRNHLRDGWSAVSWCGYRFSFEDAVFDGGDFTSARFAGGNVNFSKARFVSGTFYFNDVRFDGTPFWFDGAEFSGARVVFRGAIFKASHVSFKGAVLSGGTLDFDDARFEGGRVTFDGADHRGSTVTAARATYSDGDVNWGSLPV